MTVAWESGDWNISDLGTKPTDTSTTTRLVPIICGQEEIPIPAGQKIMFGPIDKPVRRESTNLAIALNQDKITNKNGLIRNLHPCRTDAREKEHAISSGGVRITVRVE